MAKPIGIATVKVLKRGVSGIANREMLVLECGHEIIRAPRPGKAKRVFCPECNS